jgi:hypothetical protein
MAKVLFIPVSVGGGLLAGFVGKKVFDQVWGLIDDEEPPDSKHRDISWGRLLLAGAIQGAIFRAAKEATDHAARRGFYRTTGTCPARSTRTLSNGPRRRAKQGARTGALLRYGL